MKKMTFVCLSICLIIGIIVFLNNKSDNLGTNDNSSNEVYTTTNNNQDYVNNSEPVNTEISREECLGNRGTWNEDHCLCIFLNQ